MTALDRAPAAPKNLTRDELVASLANVVVPVLTPEADRRRYDLYPGKSNTTFNLQPLTSDL